MITPIIMINTEGLTGDQIKMFKQALDEAYIAGYNTAKLDTISEIGSTYGTPGEMYITPSRKDRIRSRI